MSASLATKAARKLRTTPLVLRLLAPFGRDLVPERWIFVVGCYNSGTSLLASELASHPAIAALPQEGVFLTDALPPPERFGWTRMWCRCAEAMRQDPGPAGAAVARRIRRQWSLWLPRGPANVLEKSVANVVHIPFLAAHFRPAYFVYLVRDGYAATEGIRRKARPARWGNDDFPGGYPVELCAEQWRASDELARRHLGAVERALTLTYEELTLAPGQTLRRITDFLGLPPLAEDILARPWAIHDLNEPIRDMNADSHRRLGAADFAAIERAAGAALARYRYERPRDLAGA
ncbi:MAG: sulfotransferase family protein [Alphaproteobacteria bacterium]